MAAAGIDGSDAVIITTPALAIKLSLLAGPRFAMPILGSVAIPPGIVIVVAPSGLASAYSGALSVQTSKEAAIHYEDTTPLPISTAGTPATVAAVVRSAFQSDLIVIKVRAKAAWAAMPGAVQFLQSVNW